MPRMKKQNKPTQDALALPVVADAPPAKAAECPVLGKPKEAIAALQNSKKPRPPKTQKEKETRRRLEEGLSGYGRTRLKATGDYSYEVIGDTVEMMATLLETTGCVHPLAGLGVVNSLLDAAKSRSQDNDNRGNELTALLHELAPQNAVEGLLCSQMLACHNLAMKFSGRALHPEQTTEGVEMNVNRVTKMMRTFTAQVEALNRLRNAGKQTVVVQHVNVSDGGQAAIVGATMPGGGTTP